MSIRLLKLLAMLASFLLIITILASQLLAQEGKTDHQKLFEQIAGDYEFTLPNGAFLIIKVYIEDKKLLAVPETETLPGELEMVDEKELKFQILIPGGDINLIQFSRNKENEISKAILETPQGIVVNGIKLKKKDG